MLGWGAWVSPDQALGKRSGEHGGKPFGRGHAFLLHLRELRSHPRPCRAPRGAWGKWAGCCGAWGCVSGEPGVQACPCPCSGDSAPTWGCLAGTPTRCFQRKWDTLFLNCTNSNSVKYTCRPKGACQLEVGRNTPRCGPRAAGEDGLSHNCYLPIYSGDSYSAFMTHWVKNKTFFS